MTLPSTKCVFVFLLYCSYCKRVMTQPVTWFGPNDTYRCHCDNGCENDGSCSQNGVCQKGWFGFKCQYQDLATIENAISNQDLDKLTDRNDSTCLDHQNQLLIIQWNRTFVFTWLRIVVNDATLLSYIDVEFTSPSHPSQNLTCDNKRLYLVNQQTLDIKCDVTKEIQSILISGAGVQSICSLYINGGRNVALRHETWQSSALSIHWTSSVVVDGNTDPDLEHNSCSHTNNETSPTWSVRINAQEITRYVLYNRNENRDRLKNFILQGRGPGSTSDTGEPIYKVLDISKTIVSNVTIIATFDDGAGKYVTLCEVEIYGDCPPGTWNLDCRTCPHICQNNCHLDDGSCNEVCFGSMDPPDCRTACPAGHWGVNCTNICSVNCYGQSCDKITGVCDKACQGFSDPPSCTIECATDTWGPNCYLNCRNDCFNSSCDSQTGKCDNGCDGLMDPPDCTVECTTGKWGRNCVNQCSSKCKDQSCDRVTGFCDYISDSHTDVFYTTASQTESSSLTFSSGVGIGVAVGGVAIILIVVIIVVYKVRIKTLRNRSQEDLKPGTELQTYDSLNETNEYNYSTFEVEIKSDKKHDQEGNETKACENISNTLYETIG